MLDKTVVQLLERMVDILTLRAANIAGKNKSIALTQARQCPSFVYLNQVELYFREIAHLATNPPDVIGAYRLLVDSLFSLKYRCRAAPLDQIQHSYFVYTGPPTRRLCRNIEVQLSRIENEQHLVTLYTRNRLNAMLALLVRHGLAT